MITGVSGGRAGAAGPAVMERLEPRRTLASPALPGFNHEFVALSQNREFIATATVGDDVVFAGGDFSDAKNNSLVTDAVDIYNAATGEWSTAKLSQARTVVSHILAAGHVLFFGGRAGSSYQSPQSNAIDDFNSLTNQWTATTLPHPRNGVTPIAVGGLVIFAGGSVTSTAGPVLSNLVDIYDTATGTWTTTAMSKPRTGIVAAVVGTTAIFTDGSGADADVYDAASRAWSFHSFSISGYPVPVAVDGKLAVFLDHAVDIYDPASGKWTTDPISDGNFLGRAHAVLGTKVIFDGGFASQAASFDSEVFDVVSGRFDRTPATVQHLPVVTTVDNKAIFAGGNGPSDYGFPSFSDTVDIYDAATGQWTLSASRLSAAREGMAAITMGSLAIFGPGYGSPYGMPSAQIDVYDNASNTWSSSPLTDTDFSHGAAALRGQLLFVSRSGVDLYTSSDLTEPADPTPAAGGGVVTTPTVLTWADIPRATSYDVYLDETLVANVTTNQWTLDRSLAAGHHSWQIVARDAATFTPGPRWTFDVGLPAVPTQPSPADGRALGVTPVTLNWHSSAGASSYDVYLDGSLFGNVATNHTDLGELLSGGTHTWSIAARNGLGTTAGPTWTFMLPLSGLVRSDRPLSISGPVAAVSVGHTALFANDSSTDYVFSGTGVELYDASTGEWSTGSLSQARGSITTATVGSKAIFAGGDLGYPNYSDAVDIYDAATRRWTSGRLSVPREEMAAASVRDAVLFAGGFAADTNAAVDIYHSQSGKWTTAKLSQARYGVAGVGIGHVAFFAGGTRDAEYGLSPYSDVVDIYNARSRRHWSTAHLSVARADVCAVVVGSKVLFAGGYTPTLNADPELGEVSNVVDIYDLKTGQWSTSTLPQPRSGLSAAVVGDTVVFSGGMTDQGVEDAPNGESNVVEIYHASTGHWTTATLAEARSFETVLRAGNRVLIGGGGNNGYITGVIDVLDTVKSSWSVETIPVLPYVDNVNGVTVDNTAIFTGESTSNEFQEVAYLFNPLRAARRAKSNSGHAARYGGSASGSNARR